MMGSRLRVVWQNGILQLWAKVFRPKQPPVRPVGKGRRKTGAAWAMLAGALLLGMGVAPVLGQQGAGGNSRSGLGCGGEPITIAQLPWQSAAILASIHASLLRDRFGCSVKLVSGDAGSLAARMTTIGQPLITPEMWVGQVAAVWNLGVENDQVRVAGSTYLNGPSEGWYVPRYVLEQNPGLQSVADLDKLAQIFAPAPGDKPQFVSCPPSWACALINANLMRAYGLDKRMAVVEPENRQALDLAFSRAVSVKKPVLGYYWSPNAAIARLDLVRLDMGPYDPDAMKCLAERNCAKPLPSAFAAEQVAVAVATSLQEKAPGVYAYLQRASMPIEIMNGLLAWQSEHGADATDTARHFIETEPALWQTWVGRDGG